MAVVGVTDVFTTVFFCLFFPHDISKLDAARIIKRDLEMFHISP